MPEPLRDTETIRAARERAEDLLAADAENVRSAGWWFAEARAMARDALALADERDRLVGRLQAAEQDADGSQFLKDCAEAALRKAEARVVALETALREIANLFDDDDAGWRAKDLARAALSVSPAPTLTEPGRGNVYPGLANQYPEQPGSVSAVSPAPQERP